MRSKKFLKAEQAHLVWDVPGLVAGVDEAGRGPLAGPVVAAAVILDDLKPIKGLADSKKLTALRRERLYDEIRAKALCCSIAQASVEEIDQLNILQATMLAMRRAVLGLRLKPTKVLVDGNRLPALDVLAEAIVSGDALVPSISAASILAKVTRDRCCANCINFIPSTALTGTRVTARPNICARCRRMGPCPRTGARLHPWPGRWPSPARNRTHPHERTHRHHLARQPAAQAPARAGAGQHRLPQAGPGLARGRSPLPRVAGARSPPAMAVFTDDFWVQAPHDLRDASDHNVTVPRALMASISGLESPAGMGFVWDLPKAAGLDLGQAAVVLDCLQDAGNVGSILRSAAAFGFGQVLALKGTAALWSPKVLRAGMGAHFALRLVEGLSVADLGALDVPCW